MRSCPQLLGSLGPWCMSGKQTIGSRGGTWQYLKKGKEFQCRRAACIRGELQQHWANAFLLGKMPFQQQWVRLPKGQICLNGVSLALCFVSLDNTMANLFSLLLSCRTQKRRLKLLLAI